MTLHQTRLSESEIIGRLAAGDKTGGLCASLAFAYAANKNGMNVVDFRGGLSREAFASAAFCRAIFDADGVESYAERHTNEITATHRLLKRIQPGKEYILTTGKHAAIVKRTRANFQYLEMQSPYQGRNGWHSLDDEMLTRHFYCQKSHTKRGVKYLVSSELTEISSLASSEGYRELMRCLNTADIEQQKGADGGIR